MKYLCGLVFIFIFSIAISNSGIVSASSQFNVLDYEAIGNGKFDDSQAFLRAWKDVCGAIEDIPTLDVPVGKTFMLKPLKFEGPCKSKQVHIHLGGTIIAPSMGAWPSNITDKWIQFLDIDGLILNGTGQFDGQGSFWWKDCLAPCQRPTALFFHNCNRLRLRETNHNNSGKNHISINACNDAIISNIQIISPEDSPNTNGIDISRSNNVIIQNSTIATGDDCITLYNGSANINIVGITCGPGHGISIGTLGADREYTVVENIYVSNCLLKGTQNGLRIKTLEGGYGYAKNINFENITIIGAKNPIIVDQDYTTSANARKIKAMGIKVSDVTFREVYGTSSSENAIVLNCSQTRCSNIVMEDVSISTSTPGKEATAFCQNVDGKSGSTVPVVPCLSKSD